MTSLSFSGDVDRWFMQYFNAFIDIGVGKVDPSAILRYWSVPFYTSNPTQARWLTSSDEVVAALANIQKILQQAGYTHTKILDKAITLYNATACRVETIMSRRRGDDVELDRTAVSFELRPSEDGWIIISSTLRPTRESHLKAVW